MKVKELIEKLSTMPPEAELVSYQSDMEKSGIRPIFYNPRLEKYKIKRKSTYDRFDYTDYTYEVYDGETIMVKSYIFNRGDIVVAKDGFIGDHETLQDTVGIVIDHNPINDYLVLGVLHPENYAIPPTFSMRGEYYRKITDNEAHEWGLVS